jgi:membrane-bound lytic murein transglycosylase D
MPATARKMGLTVTPILDERLEPRRATEAAARHLQELHATFGGDWALTIAAYNSGKHGVMRIIAGATGHEALDRLLASEGEAGRYLPSVMISMLVIESPDLLD